MTFIVYIGIPTLIFGCLTIVHRLVSSQITDIDLHKLKVVQLTNKRKDGNKVAIKSFLKHGPEKYQGYIFRNEQVIAFYTTKFRLITSLIEVLHFAAIIWVFIIFSRISLYGIDLTTENSTRSILDYVIGGYFLIWLYVLLKMRWMAQAAKLDYKRYISIS